MTKTIFAGTINGKTFNDVKEYNAEMTRLLNEGASIEASTSTKSVDVCDNCGSTPCMCGEEVCNEEKSEVNTPCDFHFGFHSQNALVDQYLSGNEETDDATLDKLDAKLTTNAERVMNHIDQMSVTDLHAYLKDVNTMLGIIKENIKKNTAAQEEVEAKMTFLDNSENLLNLFCEHYNMIHNHIHEKLGKDIDKNDNSKSTQEEFAEAMDLLRDFAQRWSRMFGGQTNMPKIGGPKAKR